MPQPAPAQRSPLAAASLQSNIYNSTASIPAPVQGQYINGVRRAFARDYELPDPEPGAGHFASDYGMRALPDFDILSALGVNPFALPPPTCSGPAHRKVSTQQASMLRALSRRDHVWLACRLKK